jgi:hypothetical protein
MQTQPHKTLKKLWFIGIWVSEWVSEWVDWVEWMSERSEWVSEWVNEWSEWVSECVCVWEREGVSEGVRWVSACVCEWSEWRKGSEWVSACVWVGGVSEWVRVSACVSEWVSEWLLVNSMRACFLLYYDENKLNSMRWWLTNR